VVPFVEGERAIPVVLDAPCVTMYSPAI